MLTPAEARRQRKAILREAAAEEKKKARARLEELREHVRAARGMRKAKLADARARCRQWRAEVRERIKRERIEATIAIRKLVADERAAMVQACTIERHRAIAEARGARDQAQRELQAERKFRRDMRRIEAGNRAKLAEHKRASARERRQESDERVRGNIAPELVGLWERVKGKIRGDSRRSRTEAFLEYVEAHPHEYLEAIEDKTEALIASLEKEQRSVRKLAKAGPRLSKSSRATGAPF